MSIRRFGVYAALAAFVVHAAANPHYGFFRDELYFIICGQHPQWGYVDQPPIVPLLCALSQLFGHSLFLLRVIPAAFAAASVYAVCAIVGELEGGLFAASIASITTFFAPVLLSFGMKQSTDEVGLALWPLAAFFILRVARGASPKLMLAAGACIGLAFEAKYSVVFFAASLVAGLAFTRERRLLLNGWAAAAAGLALVIALPNALWQIAHGLPMLELLRNGQHGKNLVAGPLLFLLQQLLITNVLYAPLLLAGVYELWRRAPARFLSIAYIILIALMIIAHGKHYYPADIYPIVFAAAGLFCERLVRQPALRTAIVAYTVVAGLLFAPFVLPVLPEDDVPGYEQAFLNALHIGKKTLATENQRAPALPSDFADMHGWPRLAQSVADVYHALPPEQRAKTVVVASNYGEAAAIAFFTPDVPVISGHNQFWLWGTRGFDGSSIIDVDGDCGAGEHLFAKWKRAAVFDDPYAMPSERNLPVMLCEGPRRSLQSIWPEKREYI